MPPWGEFSPEVTAKAQRYLIERRVQKDGVLPGTYWVRGSELYRVQTDADPESFTATFGACSCLHGQRADREAHCSHVVAVLLALVQGVDLPIRDRFFRR